MRARAWVFASAAVALAGALGTAFLRSRVPGWPVWCAIFVLEDAWAINLITRARVTITADQVTVTEYRTRQVPLAASARFFDAPRKRVPHSIWLATDTEPIPVVSARRKGAMRMQLVRLNEVLVRYQQAGIGTDHP
jgi:hypothetical protein